MQDSRIEDSYAIFTFKKHLLDHIPRTHASLAAAASDWKRMGGCSQATTGLHLTTAQPHARVGLWQDLQQLGVWGNGLQRHHSIRHVLQPHRQRRIEVACTIAAPGLVPAILAVFARTGGSDNEPDRQPGQALGTAPQDAG